METHFSSGQTYVGGTAAVLQALEPSLVAANGITLSAPSSLTATGYVVTAVSKSKNTFRITRTPITGKITRTCIRANTKGGCRASLTW